LGLVAAFPHKRGFLGDVCLALPIVWSLPEVIGSLRQGWSASATVAFPIATLAMLPLLLLPWNLRDEIMAQMADVREWGCRFVVPVPRVELVT
jgi:hypothetical protein